MKRLTVIAALLFGCKDPATPKTVDAAGTSALYEVQIAECTKRGQEADSFHVYKACMDAGDAKLCAERKLRCEVIK